MATNQDFNNLIDRIDTATNTLESSVQTLSDGSADVAQAVVDAQQAANTATQQAGDAGQSATTATQAASEAASSLQEVEGIIQDFEEANVIGEAPVNGQEYVRKDGDWVLNSGGSGGGGDVVSVNGVLPDAQGDVTLDIPDEQVNSDWNAAEGKGVILNKPELFSGDYDDLTNKPTIPTQGVVSIVAGDNITIDNTDPLNPVISGEGGGGEEQGYPLDLTQDFWYDDVLMTHWPDSNPHNPLQMSKVGAYASGRWKEGMELLETANSRTAFPVGSYYVSFNDDPVGSTGGILRVYWGGNVNGTLLAKTFRFTPEPTNTASGSASPDYIAIHSASNNLRWKPIGGGGGGVTSVNNQTPDAQGNVTVAVPTNTSDLSNDSGFITLNDIPSGGGIEEAPNDGKQYARQNEEWTEVEAGGGSELGFPLTTVVEGLTYRGQPFTHWPHANPHEPILFSEVAYDHNGVTLTGGEIITESRTVARLLPAGRYYVYSNQSPDPEGGAGVIEIQKTSVGTSTYLPAGFKCIISGNYNQTMRVGYYTSNTVLVWEDLAVGGTA